MKVLIVSKEVWRDDQNGGNTLSSLFKSFPSNAEFAQIFCSEGYPINNVCDNYFKLSTHDVVYAIKNGDVSDNCKINISYNTSGNVPAVRSTSSSCSKLSSFLNKECFRELVWMSNKYKSPKLKEFILDFNPDIIFAPGYGVYYMNWLIQWIATFTSCPIISLISDDYYTYSIRSYNPLYWINQPFLRHSVRKSAKLYSLIYTMTDVQRRELEKDLKVKSKILVKSANFESPFTEKPIGYPIRLIYAGNLYANRWKTLLSLVNAIKEINYQSNSSAFLLDIYTGSTIDEKKRRYFNQEGIVSLHASVAYDKLMELYKEHDIALHVEGFDLRSKAQLRMSFSTKIIDCLSSGCVIMCICEEKQGGHEYIKSHNIGICINHPSKIKEALIHISENQNIINEYRRKAYLFGIKNHNQSQINANTYNDFSVLLTLLK